MRPAPAQPDVRIRIDAGGLLHPAGFRRHRAAGTCSAGLRRTEGIGFFGISGVHIPDNVGTTNSVVFAEPASHERKVARCCTHGEGRETPRPFGNMCHKSPDRSLSALTPLTLSSLLYSFMVPLDGSMNKC